MQIPSTCDALIIGAGPAGTAAARTLARSGVDVLLVDRRTFPRDKVCGDGLIADALAALDTLGIRERVLADAVQASELRVYAPSGRYVSLRGRFACVPRERLDTTLLGAATEAGASFLPGLAAIGPIVEGDRVAGARFQVNRSVAEVRARVTMLATGGNATALEAFSVPVALKPGGVAGRAYFEAPPDMASRFTHLTIAYDRRWCPGYGWIFPAPANRFNIGVGLFAGHPGGARLRQFWEFFRTRFGPAAEIINASRQVSEFRGAPLRTGLAGAQFGRNGLLVLGEAAAMTYPATGEGIGKAMESGLLAAGMVADAIAGRVPADGLHIAYAGEFCRRFFSRYQSYRLGQSCASLPWLVNLLARRANAGRFVRGELEALVAERGDASHLLSLRGLLTALVR